MSQFLKLTLRIFCTICLIVQYSNQITAQCTLNVVSTDGYTVHIVLTPVNVVAPATCPFGYNYNVEIDHQISFSGTNIPTTLFVLQGTLNCGSDALFFPLPNAGGNAATTTANTFRSATDCATATPESLGCDDIDLQIGGPGITNSTISCPVGSSGGTALPVELISFSGEITNRAVTIRWETALELNNDYFELQRSMDGLTWEVLDEIPGMGTTHISTRYSFIDQNPISGRGFYRLKQVDFDGSFELSNVISLNFDFENTLEIFPNPVTDILNLRGVSSESNLRIFNVYGKEFDFKTLGDARRISISHLESGIYFLLLDGEMIKFVKN